MTDRSERTRIIVPPGFRELLGSLCREILRHQPKNIVEFAAQYFEQKLRERDGDKAFTVQRIASKDLIHNALEMGEITDEVINVAATKIQSLVRGHQAREEFKEKIQQYRETKKKQHEEEESGEEEPPVTASSPEVAIRKKRNGRRRRKRSDGSLMQTLVDVVDLVRKMEPKITVAFIVAPVFSSKILIVPEEGRDDVRDPEPTPSEINRLRMFLNAFLGHPLPPPAALAHYVALRLRGRRGSRTDFATSEETIIPVASHSFPVPTVPNNTPVSSMTDHLSHFTATSGLCTSSSTQLPRAPPNTPRPSFSDYQPWMKAASASERSFLLRSTAAHSFLVPPTVTPLNSPIPSSKSLSGVVSIHSSNPASNLVVECKSPIAPSTSFYWPGRELMRQMSAPVVRSVTRSLSLEEPQLLIQDHLRTSIPRRTSLHRLEIAETSSACSGASADSS